MENLEVEGWVEQLAALIGPNPYLQAAIILVVHVIFGKILAWIISGIVGRVVARSNSQFDEKLVKLIHHPIFVSIVLIGLAIATDIIAMPATPEFITLGVLKTIAVITWYRAVAQLVQLVVDTVKRKGRNKLVRTGMLALLHNVSKVVLAALAGYFLFLAWSVDVTAWLASAGIVGLALSFAAKDTLSNLFAGVSIIMDAPYKSGDFIILDSGERGVVTDIGLRSTRILTRDDVEITIPNGIIGNGKIINEAGGPPAQHRIRVAVGVAYGSDLDQVIETLETVAKEHPEVLGDPTPRARFRQFGDSSLDFELLAWIRAPIDRGRVIHEMNCAVYRAFNAANIQIPFPQRDLHVRTMPST